MRWISSSVLLAFAASVRAVVSSFSACRRRSASRWRADSSAVASRAAASRASRAMSRWWDAST